MTHLTRLLANVLLALGAGTLTQVMVPAAALAQCSSVSNPTPPAPVVANFFNQTFSNKSPYNVASAGLVGCTGGDGSLGESGEPGSPGQPGAQISSTNSGLTIIGGYNANPFGTDRFGAPIVSFGGAGGSGGESGYVSNNEVSGGNGGAGGAGGEIKASFAGTFVRDPITGLATFGLVTSSFGGQGGSGGINDPNGTWERVAGNGGAGGAGGSVTLVANGTIHALAAGAEARSAGGGGGAGGDSTTSDLVDTTQGGAGGAGGTGGAVSLQWLSGTVQSNGSGLRANAIGGSGGDGGKAGDECCSSLTPEGGDGGAGGNGGTAGVLLSGGTISATQTVGAVTGIQVEANGGDGGAGGLARTGTSTGGGNGGNGGSGGTASATVLGTVIVNGFAGVGKTSGQAVLVQANGGSGGAGGQQRLGDWPSRWRRAGGGRRWRLRDPRLGVDARRLEDVRQFRAWRGRAECGRRGRRRRLGRLLRQRRCRRGGRQWRFGHGARTEVVGVRSRARTRSRYWRQSVGGGGGLGGDATDLAIGGGVAIGGNGGLGGNGGTVTLNLKKGVFASTSTLGGAGILAQSIGGSGGAGGSAALKGAGFLLLTIGGDAGGGGIGGTVNVTNSGLITSYGDHAAGVQAQSIGGGGGKGGAAVSFNAGSVIPTVSVAVGGRGGGWWHGRQCFRHQQWTDHDLWRRCLWRQ